MSGIAGVLLAGGQARRMGGGDKPMRELGGRPILDRIIERVGPTVAPLILNANGELSRFADYDLPVVPDVVEGFAGPLAGILTGLEWVAANAPECDWLVSYATDAPFVPVDLAERLMQGVEEEGADIGCAMSAGRTHPVFGLWPLRLREELRHALVDEDERKIDAWTARYKVAHVEFPAEPIDPFFNVNRPENLEEAERLLEKGSVT